jgi:outer membrane scaffolding protein for murein synthesis (MipA/OmpV family)
MKKILLASSLLAAFSTSAIANSEYYIGLKGGGGFLSQGNGGLITEKTKTKFAPIISLSGGMFVADNLKVGLGVDMLLSTGNTFENPTLPLNEQKQLSDKANKALAAVIKFEAPQLTTEEASKLVSEGVKLLQYKKFTSFKSTSSGFNIAPQIEYIAYSNEAFEFSVGGSLGYASMNVKNELNFAAFDKATPFTKEQQDQINAIKAKMTDPQKEVADKLLTNQQTATFKGNGGNLSYGAFLQASYKFSDEIKAGLQIGYQGLGSVSTFKVDSDTNSAVAAAAAKADPAATAAAASSSKVAKAVSKSQNMDLPEKQSFNLFTIAANFTFAL